MVDESKHRLSLELAGRSSVADGKPKGLGAFAQSASRSCSRCPLAPGVGLLLADGAFEENLKYAMVVLVAKGG